MNEETITRQLDTRWAARCLVYEEETARSTNDIAGERAGQGAPHGTLIVTASQKQGRGRNAHTWYCPPEGSIAMSLILRPRLALTAAPMLTLAAGLSVAEAVEELLPHPTERVCIKWPNDVVINGRKVCGILTESATTPAGGLACAVIGIGINVNGQSFPEDVKDVAGSVYTQTGVTMERSALIAEIMKRIERYTESLEETGTLSGFRTAYEAHLAGIGEHVRILDPQGEMIGIMRGIDENGALLVETDGQLHTILAGDVSVRGLYGYMDS